MHERERLDRILRRLDDASRLLVRAAAEMQARGIDTSSLSRPAVMIGEAIKELNEISSAAGAGAAPPPAFAPFHARPAAEADAGYPK